MKKIICMLSSALIGAGLCLTSAISPLYAQSKQEITQQFIGWLNNDLWPKAQSQGIDIKTYKAAFARPNLLWKLPDLRIPGRPVSGKQSQAEFRSPSRYFSEKSLNTLVSLGRKQLKKHARTLAKIEKKYGVPRGIIMAIWARETGYGRAKLPYQAVDVLATHAFMGRRKSYFEKELLAALKIVQQDHISAQSMKSSWAGALGHPQFLPSKFLDYAVDFDGDGKRDIWRSEKDTLASIANYLAQHGWQRGRDWGFEVTLPQNVSCTLAGPDQGATYEAWHNAGVKRANGKAFPQSELSKKGYLMLPAGRLGPQFVVTQNFYILKTYNESDVYALFIGHLADRYRSNKAFLSKWQKIKPLSRNKIEAMQKRLEKRKIDVGGSDGLIGYKTRIAVGKWQENNGQPATCFPSNSQLKSIR